MEGKVNLLLFWLMIFFVNSCITEPEEPTLPKLTEFILGKWEKVYLGYLQKDIEEIDSTIYLSIMRDNTFELFFKCKFKDKESHTVIDQRGTYEILSAEYRRYDHSSRTFKNYIIDKGYLYEGIIWFYPENQEKWGGNFTIKIREKLNFSICSTVEANDGMKIFFSFWYNY